MPRCSTASIAATIGISTALKGLPREPRSRRRSPRPRRPSGARQGPRRGFARAPAQCLAHGCAIGRRRRSGPDRPGRTSRRRSSPPRAPLAMPSRGHLGEPASDQRSAAHVVAKPEPVDDAAGDRQDVLDRATNLDAERVLGQIGSKPCASERFDKPTRETRIAAGDCHRGRQIARHLGREARPGQHRERVLRGTTPRQVPTLSLVTPPRSPWRTGAVASKPVGVVRRSSARRAGIALARRSPRPRRQRERGQNRLSPRSRDRARFQTDRSGFHGVC